MEKNEQTQREEAEEEANQRLTTADGSSTTTKNEHKSSLSSISTNDTAYLDDSRSTESPKQNHISLQFDKPRSTRRSLSGSKTSSDVHHLLN